MNYKWLVLPLVLVLLLLRCDRHQPITPFEAAWTGNAIWLREWLKNGGDPNATNENGESLLYLATGMKGSVTAIKLLLQAGADPNLCTATGDFPLLNAAICSNLDAITLLLEYGADPCCKSPNGKNAYDLAMDIQPLNATVTSLLAKEIEDRCHEGRK